MYSIMRKRDNLTFKPVCNIQYGRRAFTVGSLAWARSEAVPLHLIGCRLNFSSCLAQNELADVEEPGTTSCVGVGNSVIQLLKLETFWRSQLQDEGLDSVHGR